MIPPRPAARTQYKRPRRLNVVSVTVFLALGALVYVGYCLWPVAVLRTAAKDELSGALPEIFRANNRTASATEAEMAKLRKTLVENLRKVGVKDKKLEVKILRNKKMVGAEARFTTTAFFPGINKTRDFFIDLHVETDSARIEW